jgi:hypothetical protein
MGIEKVRAEACRSTYGVVWDMHTNVNLSEMSE